jgi:hypothetical protein
VNSSRRFRIAEATLALRPSKSGSEPAHRRPSNARHGWRRAGSRAPASPPRRRARRPISTVSAAPLTAGSQAPSRCGATSTSASRRVRPKRCCSAC